MRAAGRRTVLGAVLGRVSDLDDPMGLHRVRLELPEYGDQLTGWAPVVAVGAGDGRGLAIRPERGDIVLVLFKNGDIDHPFVLGGIYSLVDRPPEDADPYVANHWRQFRSRSGHVLRFDDSPGKERIELLGHDGQRRFLFDAGADRVELVAESGTVLLRSAEGEFSIEAPKASLSVTAGDLRAKVQRGAIVEAASIELRATTGDITVSAKGSLTLRGATIDLN